MVRVCLREARLRQAANGPVQVCVAGGAGATGSSAAGQQATLSYNGNWLVENRNGLLVLTNLLPAHGTAEREAGLVMRVQIPGSHRITGGADKA